MHVLPSTRSVYRLRLPSKSTNRLLQSPVATVILPQIEVYDNQIEVCLEALKYLTPFAYDMLTFVILTRYAILRAP